MNFKQGDKVILTFPRQPNQDTNNIGVMDEWFGKSFSGVFKPRPRYNPVVTFKDEHGIERYWICHPDWVKPMNGPW